MAEKCTNTSSPVERWINPYPFAPLNHFTVPFSLTKKLLSPAKNYSPAACLFALPWDTGHRYRTPPQRDGKNSCWRRCAQAYRTNRNGSPAFRRTVARDEIRWSRENEGAISHCEHRNVNPAAASPTGSGG